LSSLILLIAFLWGQPSQPDVPADDRRVLLELYASTGGDRWLNRTGWGSATSVCHWDGVSCDFIDGDPGRPVVSDLNLSLNQLAGSLPPSLADLKQLRSLSVFGNKLTGNLPVGLLERWDRHELQLNGGGNRFSNALARASVTYSATGALCGSTEDLRYRLEVDESTNRASFQSVRCTDASSRNTYCLVREGPSTSLLRLTRALTSLRFQTFKGDYDFPPGMTITHGEYLTTAATWGDGTVVSVRTYARQGPVEVWAAQQLFLGLLSEVSWERESRKSKCDFQD
jgi:hypothetical protein